MPSAGEHVLFRRMPGSFLVGWNEYVSRRVFYPSFKEFTPLLLRGTAGPLILCIQASCRVGTNINLLY